MKKLIKLTVALVFTVAAALSTTACSHTHKWSAWQRTETEHYRKCSSCGEEQRGEHTDYLCGDCAEFRALAFGFTSGGDTAHSNFAAEANDFFAEKGKEMSFIYKHSNTWEDLNDENLENYDLVIFLNDRPSDHAQQDALERFMRNGGAWMGYHSSAFSMVGNNEHWTWYQDEFLGCGDYKGNTWNPTSEPLTVEDDHNHCSTENIPDVFVSSPCEWYSWQSDLFANDDITVLLTLNPTEQNPAGDQPDKSKPYEIWREGKYPIAWTNNNYKMVYMNWGHNLQSYNDGEEGKESKTFSCEQIATFVLDAMFGLTK